MAYADDSTFFLRDRKSVIELMNELNAFPNFSGLKPNKTKFEIASIGVLNRVQVALCLCGKKCVILNNEIVKILGFIHLEQDKSFCEHIIKIEHFKNFKIMAPETVRKNYGFQILECF